MTQFVTLARIKALKSCLKCGSLTVVWSFIEFTPIWTLFANENSSHLSSTIKACWSFCEQFLATSNATFSTTSVSSNLTAARPSDLMSKLFAIQLELSSKG